MESALPVSLTLPPGYYIERSSGGFALHSDTFGEIGNGDFGCWAAACHAAYDHLQGLEDEAAQDAAEALYEGELDRLYAIVRAQGGEGSTAPEDKARNRAVLAVLAAIDAISGPAAIERKAA